MTMHAPLDDMFYKVDDRLLCDDCLWDYDGTEKPGRVAVMCRPVGESCAKCGRLVIPLCPAGGAHTWVLIHKGDLGPRDADVEGWYCDECCEPKPEDER